MTSTASPTWRRRWNLVFASWAIGIVACAMAACSSDEASSSDQMSFHGEMAPLKSFAFDTGMIPEVSPAQVDLALSAGSSLKVDAAFTRSGERLEGKTGGGRLALDVHFKLTGKLKVDTPLKKYDGDIPGLENVDVPVVAQVDFDPFLLEDGQSAEVRAEIPETTLPKIPLGGVPGSLTLTVVKGSTLEAKLHGTCVSVADGHASYVGDMVTTGKLVLKGTIALELPAPFNKSIDLPNIEVPLPGVPLPFTSESLAISGAPDSKAGSCANVSGSDGGSSGSSDSSGSIDTGALLSSYSISIEDALGNSVKGIPTGVNTSVDNSIRYATLFFSVPSMPQLGPNTALVLSALEGYPDGAGCFVDGGTPTQSVQFNPDDGTKRSFAPRPLSGACGLTVTKSGSTELIGAYNGTLYETTATSNPAAVIVHASFSVPLALANQK